MTLFLIVCFLGLTACKKDESELEQKIITYQLLCPAGIDACYNECGQSSGISDGTATGAEMRAFTTCTNQCDLMCNTSFLFLSQ